MRNVLIGIPAETSPLSGSCSPPAAWPLVGGGLGGNAGHARRGGARSRPAPRRWCPPPHGPHGLHGRHGRHPGVLRVAAWAAWTAWTPWAARPADTRERAVRDCGPGKRGIPPTKHVADAKREPPGRTRTSDDPQTGTKETMPSPAARSRSLPLRATAWRRSRRSEVSAGHAPLRGTRRRLLRGR